MTVIYPSGEAVDVRYHWQPGTDAARWSQDFSRDGGATRWTNWIMDFSRVG